MAYLYKTSTTKKGDIQACVIRITECQVVSNIRWQYSMFHKWYHDLVNGGGFLESGESNISFQNLCFRLPKALLFSILSGHTHN